MSARNERAKDIAIIGGAVTGHYEPLVGALVAAPILAFVWWVTS